MALRAVVTNEDIVAYYQANLKHGNLIPSSSTIYRHRLTFHLGHCRWMGALTDEILAMEGGFTRWATLDSSQQGVNDCLYHGYSLMPSRHVPDRFRDAVALINLSHNIAHGLHDAGDEEIVKEASRRLSVALVIFQGVPSGVGSGCAGLEYKLGSLSHSWRLTSSTWKSVA